MNQKIKTTGTLGAAERDILRSFLLMLRETGLLAMLLEFLRKLLNGDAKKKGGKDGRKKD